MPTTNDANEGALGSYRVAMRRYPSISQHQFNARTCYKRNGTSGYMKKSLNSADRTHLRKQARTLDSKTLEKKRRQEQALYDKAVVERNRGQDIVKQQKKDAAAAKIAAVKPLLDVAAITQGRLTNPELDAQLDWHRQFSNKIPKKKDVLTKVLKLQAVQQAIAMYLDHQETAERLEMELVEDNTDEEE